MLTVGVFGATGAVGVEFLDLLDKRSFPISTLRVFASPKSAGKEIRWRDQALVVEDVSSADFKGIDVAFFSMGSGPSLEYGPKVAQAGAVVIDNSSAFRLDQDVPLVVPEVNGKAALGHKGIIANPNCSTIQMVVALQPLHQISPLKRVVVSTYQAVSGTGVAAVAELEQQVRQWVAGEPLVHEVYPNQIAFNLFPHIDVFQENGYTKEEMKMVLETQKIMGLPSLKVSATCVRVPVIRAHSEAIWLEFEDKVTVAQACEALRNAPGIELYEGNEYPTPLQVTKKYPTFVGRVREDISVANGLSLWVVADQLYKGAALNAIQIAEYLIDKKAL